MKTLYKKVNYLAELHSDHFYHVYNRTNNKEILFKNDTDRIFFLKKYDHFLSPFLYTYSYALLDTHFHLNISVKDIETITKYLLELPERHLTIPLKIFLDLPAEERTASGVLHHQFLRLFTSYSKKFNAKWGRPGNLFHRPFKRVEIENEGHFTYLIYYHHINCQKHGLMQDFTKYRWSSYQAMLSENPTQLERAAVLDWFGGKEAFLSFHHEDHDLGKVDYLLIED